MRPAARWACLLLTSASFSACMGPNTRPDGGAWPYSVPPSAPDPAAEPSPPSEREPTLPPLLPEPTPLPRPPARPPLPPAPPSASSSPPPQLSSYARSMQASGPVLSLVKASREARSSKDFDRASASLERALRIEPRNAWLWQQMASLHLQAGQPEQAIAKARKCVSLAKRNPWIEIEAYRVMASAAAAAGNNVLAEQSQARYQDRQRWITTPPLAAPQSQ